jgi:hypothetical protein
MIKNITYAFVLLNLISSFLYLSGSPQVSITTYEYLLLLQEPIAVDDEYETNQNVQLSVAAPGVMGNDVFEDENIESFMVEPASHGVAILDTDGAFVYAPNEDFIGVDIFLYQLQGDETFEYWDSPDHSSRYPTAIC